MKTPPNNCCGRLCCSLKINNGAALRIGPPVRPSIHSPASTMSWSLISSASAIWPPIVYNTFLWQNPLSNNNPLSRPPLTCLIPAPSFPQLPLPTSSCRQYCLRPISNLTGLWTRPVSGPRSQAPLLPMPSGEPSCSSATSSLSGKSYFS